LHVEGRFFAPFRRSKLSRILILAAVTELQAQTGDIDTGKAVFQACRHCHNVLTDARKAGPSLRTLFGKVRLGNGKRANEQNVVQLITDGYNGMPSYRYILRPEDWTNLIAYLKTLRARPEVAPVLRGIRGSDDEVLASGKSHLAQSCDKCHRQQAIKATEEAVIVPLIRSGHGDVSLSEEALFSLVAYLKAR